MKSLNIGTDNHTTILVIDRHNYHVVGSKDREIFTKIKFQKDPIKENGVNGIFVEDLIAIAISRLNDFQTGDFPCEENDIAISHLRKSLKILNARTADRKKRGVEGLFMP